MERLLLCVLSRKQYPPPEAVGRARLKSCDILCIPCILAHVVNPARARASQRRRADIHIIYDNIQKRKKASQPIESLRYINQGCLRTYAYTYFRKSKFGFTFYTQTIDRRGGGLETNHVRLYIIRTPIETLRVVLRNHVQRDFCKEFCKGFLWLSCQFVCRFVLARCSQPNCIYLVSLSIHCHYKSLQYS